MQYENVIIKCHNKKSDVIYKKDIFKCIIFSAISNGKKIP